jgi:hypothetical protein
MTARIAITIASTKLLIVAGFQRKSGTFLILGFQSHISAKVDSILGVVEFTRLINIMLDALAVLDLGLV